MKGNLSEKQIEADVSGYFGWISIGTPLRLLDIDEQLTGADKVFYNAGFAFYMQFKVSNGLASTDEIPVSSRKNRSPLESIREFRKENSLGDDPTLYFGLRALAKNASDFQHNILFGYARRQCSQAFYVAPLYLDKTKYSKCLFNTVDRFSGHPFNYKGYRLIHRDLVSRIFYAPFLKGHVSIIPHERVSTHNHYYSFSGTGGDIGWHSPKIVSKNPSRLSDLLSKEIENCIFHNKFSDVHELPRFLDIGSDSRTNVPKDPIERIQHFGKKLYAQHGIRVYLLLANRDYLKRYADRSPRHTIADD